MAEYFNIEIDQEAKPEALKSEVSQELGFVKRCELLYSLDLDDDIPSYQNVQPDVTA